MEDCATVHTEPGKLPPNKRVNYAFGMVMDVDAFRQEQAHFEWKHALGNRLLHGYGTVCGLRVHAEADGPDVNIMVEPGYAVNPLGQWIWVEEQQCALLNTWVQNNRDDNAVFLAPGANQVFVNLRYQECLTDLVAIAGAACATEDNTRAHSRILESKKAVFSWEPPEQLSEDAVQDLRDILSMVTLTDDPLEDDSENFLDLVSILGLEESPMASPPGSPAESPTTSPPSDGEIRLWREAACETVQQALVTWTTQVSPRLRRTKEECILLACINFEVDPGGRVLPATVTISDCDRPVLVPTRLLQELLCLFDWDVSEDVIPAALGDLDDVNAPTPGDGEVLIWSDTASEWQPGAQPPGPHNHDLGNLDDVDAPSPSDGEVLTWNDADCEWQPDARPPEPHTHNLEGLDDVSLTSPAEGDLLAFNETAGQWEAQPSTFVARPALAGPYLLVGAGWFAADGTLQSPSYNNLRARALISPDGDYVIRFDGYVNPLDVPASDRIMYIVKGTVQDAPTAILPRSTFEFVRFQDNGIRVRVLHSDGEILTGDQGFMVEISAYGPLP